MSAAQNQPGTILNFPVILKVHNGVLQCFNVIFFTAVDTKVKETFQ